MSIKARRGTDAQRLAITFDSGEICWTTDTNLLYIGDGVTAGGVLVGSGSEVNDLSAAVTWANIPDANVPASAVTQHEGSIDHDALTNFVAAEHIDWSVTGAEDINVDRIAVGAVTQHEASLTITESQISDLGTYLTDAPSDGTTYGRNNGAWTAVVGGGGLNNVVEDTTPQLGGSLDVNSNAIVSVSNGDIDLTPNGTGNVSLGSFTFDADQTVGVGQDNYVLTYDNGTGLISLEAVPAGGSEVNDLSAAVTWVNVPDANITQSSVTQHEAALSIQDGNMDTEAALDGQVLTSDGAGNAAWETPASGVTDHTLLSNIGTNTHAQIDTHIADSTIHATASTAQTLTNKTIDGDNNTISNLDIGNEVDWPTAADVTDATAFASGDKLLIHEAGVGLRKIDFDDLPSGGGGLSNVVEDTTPQLGGDLETNGNDIILGSGDNILGHFADATVNNLTALQSAATNSTTAVVVKPNGTSTTSSVLACNTSDITNTSRFVFGCSSTQAFIDSNVYGTGTVQPLNIYTGGTIAIGIDTSQNVEIPNMLSVGDSVTASNATRALNLCDTTATMRVLRVGADVDTGAPAVEMIHRTTSDGSNNEFWDIYPSSTGFNFRDRNASNAVRLQLESNGTLNVAGTTTYENLVTNDDDIPNKKYVDDAITASDRRVKEQVTTADLGLDFINKLEPVSYQYTFEDETKKHYGFIAQDVESLVQDAETALVNTVNREIDGEDQELLGIRYQELIAPLVKAVQELTARVEELESK